MPSLLEIDGLTRRFGGLTAVDGVSLSLGQGELLSVIGPNGAGKTTLFNLVTGLDAPDEGRVRFDGEDITGWSAPALAQRGLARTFQHGRVFANLSVLDNVLVGAHTRLQAARPRLGGIPGAGALAELALALVQPPRVAREERRLREEALEIIALFGTRLAPRIDHPAYSLSYANRRRVEIARALAANPRYMLLDEPFAGVDPISVGEIQRIVRHLKERGIGVLITDHNVRETLGICDRAYILNEGEVLSRGTPAHILADEKVREVYLGREFRL